MTNKTQDLIKKHGKTMYTIFIVLMFLFVITALGLSIYAIVKPCKDNFYEE